MSLLIAVSVGAVLGITLGIALIRSSRAYQRALQAEQDYRTAFALCEQARETWQRATALTHETAAQLNSSPLLQFLPLSASVIVWSPPASVLDCLMITLRS